MAELETRGQRPASGGLHCDGQDFARMLGVATAWLERYVPAINALNVFPVPDGDTGTNMLLSMQAALKEVRESSSDSVVAAAKAAAYGSLMGARGNSGVILSQILRGLANGLEGAETMGSQEFARGLSQGSITAYQGVIQPVEGTMLTVVREAAEAAQAAASAGADLIGVLERTVAAARQSVAKTTSLLDVLREAGVVDAGGEGLYVILDGFLRYLKGEELPIAQLPQMAPGVRLEAPAPTGQGQMEWGYCTEFIIQGQALSLPRIRKRIAGLGDSALVVGDSDLIKVHVHTFDPGKVLSFASGQGILHKIKIDNMQDQHHQYLLLGQEAGRAKAEVGPSLGTLAPSISRPEARVEPGIGVVAVVVGEGLRRVFESLGATGVVPGGQTMNPSTQEILGPLEAQPSEHIILLPNNKNIWMAAEQARKLSKKQVRVVPTQTLPQGVAALLAFNPKLDLETNLQAMHKAAGSVHTLEITTAVRPTSSQGIVVKKGHFIALLNDQLVAAGPTLQAVVRRGLGALPAEQFEVITLYYGDQIDPDRAQELADQIRRWYPQQQVECIHGGQPHYPYIISVE
ncbi:MAG: DAK2 domain-containing protein [Chloroflexi bacterium]|nr:DAK2 domain-containing protein [Chloroflexota bacterium]